MTPGPQGEPRAAPGLPAVPPRAARRRSPALAAGAVLALAGALLLLVPVAALALRAGDGDVLAALRGGEVRDALALSVWTAALATGTCLLVGVPLAWVLARSALPGLRVLRALVVTPLVLPPVVGGVALLLVLGRTSTVGGLLADVGVRVPFTPAAVVVAQTFVALPFLVLAVEAALRGAGRGLEDVAATLGAPPRQVLLRVTLPGVAPALAAGSALAFARALGEFGATLTLAGSLPGRTQTVPVAVSVLLASDPDAAVALSVVLVAVCLVVLVALRGRWWAGVPRPR